MPLEVKNSDPAIFFHFEINGKVISDNCQFEEVKQLLLPKLTQIMHLIFEAECVAIKCESFSRSFILFFRGFLGVQTAIDFLIEDYK